LLGSSKTRPLGRSRPNAGQLALAFNIGSLPRFSRASDLCAAALRSRQVSRDAALKRALGLSKTYQIRQVSSQYRSESLLGRPEMCQIGRMFTFLLMVMRSREQTDAAACGPLRLTKLVHSARAHAGGLHRVFVLYVWTASSSSSHWRAAAVRIRAARTQPRRRWCLRC